MDDRLTKQKLMDIFANLESGVIRWLQRYDRALARCALAVVYLWFGVLKLFGISAANPMVATLQAKTLPFLTFDQFIALFALFEVLIGVLFLVPQATRIVTFLFVIHMATTLLPLFFLPGMTWQKPFAPTLEGQYIIKNVALIALVASLTPRVRSAPVRGRRQDVLASAAAA